MEVNKIVCIDNLELMRSLPSESIDLIYSDILYGTGKKFKDYQDLKADRKIIEEFYIPRIKEMYRLLKNTGSIYLQMDWRIVHWIRQILDDIFGYENFKNEITWEYPTPARSKTFVHNTDKIMLYTKSSEFIFNTIYVEDDKYRQKIKGYLFEEDGKLYYYRGRNLKDSEYIRKFRTKEFVENNNLQSLFAKKEYVGVKLGEVWNDLPTISQLVKENTGYDTQKSLKLMERIIKSSSNEGNVCADFFMGSGSFLVKAKELGRQYIGCDINSKAVEITYNRTNGFIYE